MEVDLSTDDDRTEWDEAWRNRPLRQLVCPVQIDVTPTPNHTFGNVTHVDIAADRKIISVSALPCFGRAADPQILPRRRNIEEFWL